MRFGRILSFMDAGYHSDAECHMDDLPRRIRLQLNVTRDIEATSYKNINVILRALTYSSVENFCDHKQTFRC